MIADRSALSDREKIVYLREQLGENQLVKLLVDQFFKLGRAGESHADVTWELLGLNTENRTALGQALQSLLEVIDRTVEEVAIEELHGMITITNTDVSFSMPDDKVIESVEGYRVEIGK